MTTPNGPVDAAIARGQADVLDSRVSPHPLVAQKVAGVLRRAAPTAGSQGQRAVVWSDSARDAYLAAIQALAATDATLAQTTATAIDAVAEALGHTPTGVDGRLPHTWEKAVAKLPYLLVFELVTWTKAGEVIAIDALLHEAGAESSDAPLF